MDAFWSFLMLVGSAICHQLPDRSYFLAELQMPLCARSIGIQLGFLLSSMFLWTGSRKFASAIADRKSLIVLVALFFIGFGDGVLSYSGVSQSDNIRRTVSGLLIGTTIPFFIVPLLNKIVFPERNHRVVFRKISDWGSYAVLFAAGAAMIFAATSFAPLFYAVSVLGIIGIFVLFFTMMTLLVMVLLDESPLRNRSKYILSALLVITILSSLAIIHHAFFPQI